MKQVKYSLWDAYDRRQMRIVVPVPSLIDGWGNGLPLSRNARLLWQRIPNLHELIGASTGQRQVETRVAWGARARVIAPRVAILPVCRDWRNGLSIPLLRREIKSLARSRPAKSFFPACMPRFGEDQEGRDWEERLAPLFQEYWPGGALLVTTDLEVYPKDQGHGIYHFKTDAHDAAQDNELDSARSS